MENNKDIISELKRYNSDLEKHIPGLDINLIKPGSLLNTSKNDDYLTLFAENLVDLRTEMALLRKNMSVDIEGMVLRVVNNQQNKFSQRMNDFFVKAILDVKETWDSRLTGFTDEFSQLKKVFNEMKIQNENLVEIIKTVNEDILLLKSSIKMPNQDNSFNSDLTEKLDFLDLKLNKILLVTNNNNNSSKIIDIENTLENLNLNSYKNEMNNKMSQLNSNIRQLKVENSSKINISEMDNKFIQVEKKFNSILKENEIIPNSLNSITDRVNSIENSMDIFSKNIDNKIDNQNKSVELNLDNLSFKILEIEKKKINNVKVINSIEPNLVHMNEKPFNKKLKIKNFNKKLEKKFIPIKSKIIKEEKPNKISQKLLDIDSRLQKLNNLR